MLAELPLKLPTQEEKLWGHYEANCQKGFLQDIIDHFNETGEPIYHFQDPISSHIYFDTCTRCEECYWVEQLELDVSEISFTKKSKSVDPQPFEPQPCKSDLKPQNPDADNFQAEHSGFDGYQIPSRWVYQVPKKEKILHPYYQNCLDILEKEARKQTKKIQKEWKPVPQSHSKLVKTSTQPIQCFMFQEADFPPLESFVKNGSKHTPKIQNAAPIILPTGEAATTDISYEILNWQTENSLVQNSALTSIHQNVSTVSQQVSTLGTSVNYLDTSVNSQKEEVSKMISVLERRLASLKYDSPLNASSLANFVLSQEKETAFLQKQIATLKTTGEIPKYDVGPSEPPSQVSLGFGAIPLRNWPTPFYFAPVTTPNPSVFFPDQPQPISQKPWDIAEVLREYRRKKKAQAKKEKEEQKIEAQQKRQEEERQRKQKQIATETSLMYTIQSNPIFSARQEQQAVEATKVYENPLSSMLEDLHQQSIPCLTTSKVDDNMKSQSSESEAQNDTSEEDISEEEDISKEESSEATSDYESPDSIRFSDEDKEENPLILMNSEVVEEPESEEEVEHSTTSPHQDRIFRKQREYNYFQLMIFLLENGKLNSKSFMLG